MVLPCGGRVGRRLLQNPLHNCRGFFYALWFLIEHSQLKLNSRENNFKDGLQVKQILKFQVNIRIVNRKFIFVFNAGITV